MQYCFHHIPKTAGSSLTLFLKDLTDNKVIQYDSHCTGKNQGINIICEKTGMDIKHVSIHFLKHTYGTQIDDYFKFTIVRNPYDRMLSYYFFRNKGQKFDKESFIEAVKNYNNFQYKFIDNSFHIVYYENLIDDLKNIDFFKNKVNFDNLCRLNFSYNSKLDYRSIYDNDRELKDLVYNKFQKDFKVFGYKY